MKPNRMRGSSKIKKAEPVETMEGRLEAVYHRKLYPHVSHKQVSEAIRQYLEHKRGLEKKR